MVFTSASVKLKQRTEDFQGSLQSLILRRIPASSAVTYGGGIKPNPVPDVRKARHVTPRRQVKVHVGVASSRPGKMLEF